MGATVVVHGLDPAAPGENPAAPGERGPTAQVLTRGAGFVSCQPPELVFGLGEAPSAAVEVIWPGGTREAFGALPRGSRMLLVEGTGAPEPYAARPRPLPDPLPPGLLVEEGEVLPPLALLDADGGKVVFEASELADGKPLFLIFWGTFCPPCVAEIPVLQKLHAAGEVRVVAISMDVPDDVARAEEVLAARGAEYPRFYIDPRAGDAGIEKIVDLLRLPLPTTLIVTPDGRIDTILNGPIREDY
ncbi:MAG: redoxin domain-containing protein [Planctomycetota bacterium]|nr:redoxin domain-containing protein [Planctomycetota bacterium]